jgi:hypothetical protein
MNVSVTTRTLTDGSRVWAVVFVDGSTKAVINCENRRAALSLQLALHAHALDASIEAHKEDV